MTARGRRTESRFLFPGMCSPLHEREEPRLLPLLLPARPVSFEPQAREAQKPHKLEIRGNRKDVHLAPPTYLYPTVPAK